MAIWYYADGDDRQGPVEAIEIERLIGIGQITAETLVWRSGMNDWEAARLHFASAGSAGTSPPLSSAPPPMMPGPSSAPNSQPGDDQIGSDGLYVGAPSRSFGEAISICFSKYVGFSGRASRSEFWFFVLFTFIVSLVTGIVDLVLFPTLVDVSPLNSIASLALFLPGLAVGFRRLHDNDRSGWWVGGFYLAAIGFGVVIAAVAVGNPDNIESVGALAGLGGLVFIAFAITLLVFYCQRGTLGPNRFG